MSNGRSDRTAFDPVADAGVSRATAPSLPPLTVAVVNWNGHQHLAGCLGSLLANGYPELQIVLVDNASSDDSVAFTSRHYPTVEILAATTNLRWAGGNNLALRWWLERAASGAYILLLNNDTIVPPGNLQRLVAAAVAEPRAWAATPRICYAGDPDRVWYDGGVVGRRSGWVRHRGIRRPVLGRPTDPRFVDYGTGCALLLGRRAVEAVGELDESYYLYGEDTDYCLRLRAAGGRVLHVPTALVLHKVSAALGDASARKIYLRSRSHVQLLRRHWPRRCWPHLAVSQLAFYSGHALWHLGHGRPATAKALVTGLIDELRGAKA